MLQGAEHQRPRVPWGTKRNRDGDILIGRRRTRARVSVLSGRFILSGVRPVGSNETRHGQSVGRRICDRRRRPDQRGITIFTGRPQRFRALWKRSEPSPIVRYVAARRGLKVPPIKADRDRDKEQETVHYRRPSSTDDYDNY